MDDCRSGIDFETTFSLQHEPGQIECISKMFDYQEERSISGEDLFSNA